MLWCSSQYVNLFAAWLFVCYLGDEGSSCTEESNKPLSWLSAAVHSLMCPYVYVKSAQELNQESLWRLSHGALGQLPIDTQRWTNPVGSGRPLSVQTSAALHCKPDYPVLAPARTPPCQALMSNVTFCFLIVCTQNRCRALNASERTDQLCESDDADLRALL